MLNLIELGWSAFNSNVKRSNVTRRMRSAFKSNVKRRMRSALESNVKRRMRSTVKIDVKRRMSNVKRRMRNELYEDNIYFPTDTRYYSVCNKISYCKQ